MCVDYKGVLKEPPWNLVNVSGPPVKLSGPPCNRIMDPMLPNTGPPVKNRISIPEYRAGGNYDRMTNLVQNIFITGFPCGFSVECLLYIAIARFSELAIQTSK